MIKNKKYNFCAIILCVFMVHIALASSAVSDEQNGIAILVEDFRSNVGEFLPFPIGSGIMSGHQMLQNRVQPIRVTIHNKSDKPVIVNLSSLPAMHVNIESILDVHGNMFTLSLIIAYLWGISGGMFMWLHEDKIMNSYHNLYQLNHPRTSSYPVTTAWLAGSVAAAIAPWFFVKSKKEQAKRELDTFCLYNETVIKPGYKVTRLAFLDAATYSSFFTFRVLSEDKMEFVATFDVDMLGA